MKNKVLQILFVFGFMFWCKIVSIPVLILLDFFANKILAAGFEYFFEYGFLLIAITVSLGLFSSEKISLVVQKAYEETKKIRIYFIFVSWALFNMLFEDEILIYGLVISLILAVCFNQNLKLFRKVCYICIWLVVLVAMFLGNLFYNF